MWWSARKLLGFGMYTAQMTSKMPEYNHNLSKHNLSVNFYEGPPSSSPNSPKLAFFLKISRIGGETYNTEQPLTNNQINVEVNNGNQEPGDNTPR